MTISGCRGAVTLPSVSSSKPKYAYLDVVTTPPSALVYMKTHASVEMSEGVSLLPIDVEQPGCEDPEWELIGTTPIDEYEILQESHATFVSLLACASLDMRVSIDMKIEKDGYESILLNDVSLRTDERTRLEIDLVQTDSQR
jgi:hypothetical protein